MPWLKPSTSSEVGAELRASFVPQRKTVNRYFLGLLVIGVILLLWRWIGSMYYP